MDTPAVTCTVIIDLVKSWLFKKTKSANVSRDFWMPDHSCIVCYECDSQFTIFNRRHHCRLCGKIFCGKCTSNSIPAPSDEPKTGWEEWERIRVCNYCFKEQEKATDNNGVQISSPVLSPSPSATSLVSTKTSGTANTSSTTGSMSYSNETYQHVSHGSELSPSQGTKMESSTDKQGTIAYERSTNSVEDARDPSPNDYGFFTNRSDDDYDEYNVYQLDSETRHFPQDGDYYGSVDYDEIEHAYASNKVYSNEENIDIQDLTSSHVLESLDLQVLGGVSTQGQDAEGHNNVSECHTTSLYGVESKDAEPVDFENNGLLWLAPGPEDEEDEKEVILFDDDDDDATGEWRYLRSSSSFDSGDFRSKEKSSEEHKKAMKTVVDGHFRALIAQLLQVENLHVGGEDETENWLEIITSLSWEAATLLKPDTSKGGGMDPGGYVKVKCLACGRRSESMVVKGVVCKKNVAHRRMTSKIEKPRFLILGGALEYQRVSNSLSSIDTLLQQEMDHLKMAVAKIDAHHPNVLLVEKTVSRFAQDYLHAKDIALVLNIKRPLLERIARCTGAQIVPSIDHLSTRKLGFCDTFHVDKFLEEHGSAGQAGRKLVKTLMFFEGCPKPLGYTILLKGANGDELKKVKHVVQYGIFAAYHLAMETSFLADEGASLPIHPLKTPITVALPDKPSSTDGSISTIPGFTAPLTGKALGCQISGEPHKLREILTKDLTSLGQISSVGKWDMTLSPLSSKSPLSQCTGLPATFVDSPASFSSLSPPGNIVANPFCNELSDVVYEEGSKVGGDVSFEASTLLFNSNQDMIAKHISANDLVPLETTGQELSVIGKPQCNINAGVAGQLDTYAALQQDRNNYHEDQGTSKEEFPQGTPDHQSILVFLSTRCIWKGTACERAHLFRIKYYGNSDKPLGRFLRDHLFDQSFRCRSCDMPSEAHVHSYTHRQGTLTISVKKLPDLLPGEREGKIWMWHRCLRCPRTDGYPPATRRVVMSDAAWGLSFGKFLELSFSNHAAASRVASCGHSLHRDCLRFYGFGRMIACFRYASIDVHSVYLPPPQIDFKCKRQEWIEKEANEVLSWAGHLFSEIQNLLQQLSDQISRKGSPNKNANVVDSRCFIIANLERMLEKEKEEFEESLQKAFNKDAVKRQSVIDILEINRLRRQLIFQSYLWDKRLVHAASLDNSTRPVKLRSVPNCQEKPQAILEKLADMKPTSNNISESPSCDSLHVDADFSEKHNQGGNHLIESAVAHNHRGRCVEQEPNNRKEGLSTSTSLDNQSDPLESGIIVQRALSDGQYPSVVNLSETLDTAWIGENPPGNIKQSEDGLVSHDSVLVHPSSIVQDKSSRVNEHSEEGQRASVVTQFPGSVLSVKVTDNTEEPMTWLSMPFTDFYHSVNMKSSRGIPKLDSLSEYNPVYVSSFRDLERLGGARFFLPMGVNDTVVPVYDDELTSVISYALVSPDYHLQISDEREKSKEGLGSSVSLPLYDPVNLHAFHSHDDMAYKTSESLRSLASVDGSILSMSGSRSSLILDPVLNSKSSHVTVSFTDAGPLGKVKYTVTCYHAKRFEALRRICCPSELDFIRSLSRCKKWGAQGGKSNVFFAKSLDDRFIIKQVTKTELESFIQFAPEYFKYLSESIVTRSPTSLAKILGIYQVSKQMKGGKETRMDLLVMENLLFERNITRLYDLKGSSRSRYNPDSSGSNKVLLDQNLIEAMPTSPIFVGNKAKRLLERAVWNDTSFLASIDVMDYSLLVGVDEEKHELVLGIIDFMRQYTWDKHLETWVKASGILGGPKNSTPTVISPMQYKKRFRKAMSEYFLMLPDQWSPPTIIPSGSQSDLCEENAQSGNFLE